MPTVSVLLGEGSGGGAIALLPADRVLAAEHGWLSPIAPEGASVILHRTTERADELAVAQAIGATALRRLDIVDLVVAERDVPAAPAVALREVATEPSAARRLARAARYRKLGLPA